MHVIVCLCAHACDKNHFFKKNLKCIFFDTVFIYFYFYFYFALNSFSLSLLLSFHCKWNVAVECMPVLFFLSNFFWHFTAIFVLIIIYIQMLLVERTKKYVATEQLLWMSFFSFFEHVSWRWWGSSWRKIKKNQHCWIKVYEW